jgi:dihydroorotate dehydrogenase electron transfer subunit
MRSSLATVLQLYHPWPRAIGLTLASNDLSVPVPGQCLLIGRESQALPQMMRLAMPTNFNKHDNTLDVLLRFEAGESFTWGRVQRDDTLLITGPIGRPFLVDKRVRRALLVDDGSAMAPLLYLLHRLVELSVEVTYLAIRRDPGDGVPARALPPEIEYIAIEAAVNHEANAGVAARIETLLPWADSLYLALDLESLPHILTALRRGLMRLRKGFAQAIVLPDLLPCGVGACDLCTIVTREGYRRICRDGLVFDLLTLH